MISLQNRQPFMRALIQRVKKAAVHIGGEKRAEIGPGMLVLLGVSREDDAADAEYLCRKIANLRIFDDEQGVMNLNIAAADGECLVVSQFTLYADTRKGNRPSYYRAAGHETAVPLYEKFCQLLSEAAGRPVQKGVFGAEMKCALINDGPVTIIIDSRLRE